MVYITHEMYLDWRKDGKDLKMHIGRFMLSTRLQKSQSISQQNSVSPYHNQESKTYVPGHISVCRVHCSPHPCGAYG